jgi:hypothetical protein
VLALIEGGLEVVDVTHTETIRDDVIEAVEEVVEDWIFVVIEDTLANIDDVTVDDEDGTTEIVDVSDASIEIVDV